MRKPKFESGNPTLDKVDHWLWEHVYLYRWYFAPNRKRLAYIEYQFRQMRRMLSEPPCVEFVIRANLAVDAILEEPDFSRVNWMAGYHFEQVFDHIGDWLRRIADFHMSRHRFDRLRAESERIKAEDAAKGWVLN